MAEGTDHADRQAKERSKRRVLFLLLPDVHVLDFAGAMQVFYEASRFTEAYSVHSVGTSQRVTTAQGLELSSLEPLPDPTARGAPSSTTAPISIPESTGSRTGSSPIRRRTRASRTCRRSPG